MLAVVLLMAVMPARVEAQGFSLEHDFAVLDTVVRNVDKYMEERQRRIDEGVNHGPFPTEINRYTYYKHMFDEYKKFCSDSALVYVRLCKRSAERAGLAGESLLADIDLLYITALQGNLFAADSMARRLPPIDDCPKSLQVHVAIAMLEYKSRVGTFSSNTSGESMMGKFYTKSDTATWNFYSRYLPRDSWLADYYEGLFTTHDLRQRLSRRLKTVPRPSVAAAMLSLVMAKSCMAYGSADEACHYLILSAVNDIMSANREAASLTMLLYTPYIDKNSQRAADYALACVKIANGYKDMARSFDIVKANSIIISDYMKMQRRVRTTSLVIIVLLVVLVAMGAVLVYILVRRARRRKAQLDRAMGFNSRLSRTLAEITETKESIEDASARRNALTLDAYVHMSDYINDVDKFCKTTANMITAGQTAKARKALQEGCTAPFLSSLYASFDRWYLSVHPDFIQRFMALLRPEERGRFLAAPGELSPELRIYALVSLGITDSVSIAEFLHYSPQTIYNYCLRVRHCARIPEKDFAATVAAMYSKEEKSEK